MSEPRFQVGKPFTFTDDEEQEIAMLLRQAQRALWTRTAGYRGATIDCVTRVNRIIHRALGRSHGAEDGSGLMLPPLPVAPPRIVD